MKVESSRWTGREGRWNLYSDRWCVFLRWIDATTQAGTKQECYGLDWGPDVWVDGPPHVMLRMFWGFKEFTVFRMERRRWNGLTGRSRTSW